MSLRIWVCDGTCVRFSATVDEAGLRCMSHHHVGCWSMQLIDLQICCRSLLAIASVCFTSFLRALSWLCICIKNQFHCVPVLLLSSSDKDCYTVFMLVLPLVVLAGLNVRLIREVKALGRRRPELSIPCSVVPYSCWQCTDSDIVISRNVSNFSISKMTLPLSQKKTWVLWIARIAA